MIAIGHRVDRGRPQLAAPGPGGGRSAHIYIYISYNNDRNNDKQ